MEWLFLVILIVSILHVIEEYLGGFVDQMKQFMVGADISEFVSINMTFLILGFIAVIVGSASLIYSLSIAALLFINVLFHIGCSIRLKGYNAGLITALLLYLPVSIYAYYYFWALGSLSPIELILSIILGVFWMIMVFIYQFIQLQLKRRN